MVTAPPASALPRWGKHMPALDGIRGIAVLLVMACHFVLYGGMVPANVHEIAFSRLMLSGWIGVDLFFVLSGFLITGILFDAKGTRGYFRNFYMRRLLRIFPLYYGFLAFFFFGIPWLFDVPSGFASVYEDQNWYWAYLSNFRIAIDGWPALPGSIGHFWTLAVEEQFYIVWPAVVFALSRKALIRVCVACILGGWFFRAGLTLTGSGVAAYVLTPARMDALAMGGLLAVMGRDREGLELLRRWAVPVAGVAVTAAMALFLARRGFGAEDPVIQLFGYSAIALFFSSVVVLAATASTELLGSWMTHPLLSFFGKYSYGLYVFHLPLTTFLEARVLSVAQLPLLWGSQLPAQLLFFVVAGSLSTGIAVLSWHLFEAPILGLKRLFPHGPQASPVLPVAVRAP